MTERRIIRPFAPAGVADADQEEKSESVKPEETAHVSLIKKAAGVFGSRRTRKPTPIHLVDGATGESGEEIGEG
jgi:hypothetical protein